VTSAILPARLNSDSDMAYPRKMPDAAISVCARGAALGKQVSID